MCIWCKVRIYRCEISYTGLGHTNFSAVPAAVHATGCSEGSANRDNCELPGLVSALRGRNDVNDVWFVDNAPEADDGLEFGPHVLAIGSWALSLLAVDGRVPLPDEGRPLRWHGEPVPPSVGESEDEPHGFDAEDDLLPQLRVPLQVFDKQHKKLMPLLIIEALKILHPAYEHK